MVTRIGGVSSVQTIARGRRRPGHGIKNHMVLRFAGKPSGGKKTYNDSNLVVRYPLNRKNAQEFARRVDSFPHAYEQFDKNAVASSRNLRKLFPTSVIHELENIATNKSPALLLKGLPTHKPGLELMQTPRNLKQRPDKDRVSESMILGIAGLLDSLPKVARDNESGDIVMDAISQIAPVDVKSHEGAGSKIAYKMHTEASGARKPPHNFALMALRGQKGAKTVYLTTDQIVPHLTPKTVRDLQRKEFRFNPKKGKGNLISSVLRKNMAGKYEVRLNLAPNRTEPLTPRAKKALEEIDNIVSNYKPMPHVELEAGDVVIMNNRLLLHGRSPFKVSPRARRLKQERWLQRGYFGKTKDHYDIHMKAFRDNKGRHSHEIIPVEAGYKTVKDFVKNASKQEKLQLFDKFRAIAAGKRGYRFVMDQDPKTKELRVFVATTDNPAYPDSRWEQNNKKYKKRPVSMTNNPLYDKANPRHPSVKDMSSNFTMFSSLKPNHELVVPRQHVPFKDLLDFAENGSARQKIELLDMLAKHSEDNSPIYFNGGVSRHIPWMHGHLLRGMAAKAKFYGWGKPMHQHISSSTEDKANRQLSERDEHCAPAFGFIPVNKLPSQMVGSGSIGSFPHQEETMGKAAAAA